MRKEDKMEFNVRYNVENDCLIGSYTGRMDRDTVQPYAEEIMSIASKHTCKLFMSDIRKAQIDFSIVDIYYLPGVLDAAGLDRSWRRAIVASKQVKELCFFETVAQNRGYSVKVFADLDEAMKWLTAER
jgi:hypothetical protein